MVQRKSRRASGSSWFELLAGEEVGNYILDRYIGHGKIGYVYRASLKRVRQFEPVAVKLTPGKPRSGWENELQKVSRLRLVQNVVHFHELGATQVTKGSITELVQYTVWDFIPPGQNLRQYLSRTKSCSTSFFFGIITTILRVLHACKQKKVARHGDLHAGNILIGKQDDSLLDSKLQPIAPVYVSDFGYGATGGKIPLKDDYLGLAQIADEILERVDWDSSNTSDRQLLTGARDYLAKVLREKIQSERLHALDILRALESLRLTSGGTRNLPVGSSNLASMTSDLSRQINVGQFQVSEMLGDDWDLWRSLFVPTVPARSRVLERDITSVVTGPRGCGKTMLFRRLSEKLVLECGPVDENSPMQFLGFYVNANDMADAFSQFPPVPNQHQLGRLYCYLHLCILADVLAVQSIRSRKYGETCPSDLLHALEGWFGIVPGGKPLVSNEDPLERYRASLEQLKHDFISIHGVLRFPAYSEQASPVWLRSLIPLIRKHCPWARGRMVFIFLDDYTTPRVSVSMQRALNRVVFQRSSDFVFKIATEAATTFVAEDSYGKQLQDGDDYKLVDMGEESLFMSEDERNRFLNDVFSRRLARDPRVEINVRDLPSLLGHSGTSKTEFARVLRSDPSEKSSEEHAAPSGNTKLRGATKRRALYHGCDVFAGLWSGDTRLLIQLIQDVVDEASKGSESAITQKVDSETQDRIFRNRGGQWLEMQVRNQPTDPRSFDSLLANAREFDSAFQLTGGSFGAHLKAIVEAFMRAARFELLGPVYEMREGDHTRTVPKMAFRLEITDEFRLDGLCTEIYRDLIRYGLFMRDARGKSVRGAMVPRLYLRRLLLPYCLLALSKRDSVSMNCERFRLLLLRPDEFARQWASYRAGARGPTAEQSVMFVESKPDSAPDERSIYNDLDSEDEAT